MKSSDSIKSMIHCYSHDVVYFFTNTGRVIKSKAYEIPKKSRTSLGVSAAAFLKISNGERVTDIMKAPEEKGTYLILITRNGFVKKTPADPVFESKNSGLKIITLEDGDELVSAVYTKSDENMFVLSSKGKASIFNTSEVRETGRSSMGVRSMRLNDEDYILTAFIVHSDEDILSISEHGYGKRTNISEFPVHHRGSSGVMIYRDTDRTGKVSHAIPVKEEDEVLLVSMNEKTIRIKASEIPETSRVTSGVKLIDLDDDDRIIAAAVIK